VELYCVAEQNGSMEHSEGVDSTADTNVLFYMCIQVAAESIECVVHVSE
jgi:hypothetical protein